MVALGWQSPGEGAAFLRASLLVMLPKIAALLLPQLGEEVAAQAPESKAGEPSRKSLSVLHKEALCLHLVGT
jgi:hypothetical protein